MRQKLQHLINHVSLIVDKSSSMADQPVVKIFDRELENLKKRSVDMNQETRISIYLFNESIECLTFDMDVMRFSSLQGHYTAWGWTALIDAVIKSTEDNQKLPELYGDHAFLQYVITDGKENRSQKRAEHLQALLGGLPDNWTTACLVPDKGCADEAERFGFNGGCISIWDTQAANALDKLGTQFSTVMDSYMDMRSKGVRGTKGLFTIQTDNLTKSGLEELDPRSYEILPVREEGPIKEYVEKWTKQPYRLGSCYYQPTKPVVIQDHKDILVQDVKNGRVYEGQHLRSLLGLPKETVKANPGTHKNFRIFIKSTSSNRKLYRDTFLLKRN